ncbi:MAG: chitin disaccharide deacetylase [Bacillota bacterium]
MKLIVNADDFALSKGVNLGIVEAYKKGVVRSTTMMMNMDAVDHGFSLMRDYPGLGLGIHLVLTAGRPLCSDVPSLMDDKGNFHNQSVMADYAKEEDVEKEFRMQLDRFLSYGVVPTHIDSHHHVHLHERVLPIVLKLASEFHLPVRLGNKMKLKKAGWEGIKTTDFFTAAFYGSHLTVEGLTVLLEEASRYPTVELMCHPSYVDDTLKARSSYTDQREKELKILTDERLMRWIEEKGIELIHYAIYRNTTKYITI